VLAIDQTRCTDCNNCVDACGRRHGTPRLERRGLQLDTLLFPSACRHCEDPLCLLCTVNGIVRRPDGEISIVQDNCIGCGGCAERCPYDNIQLFRRDRPGPSIGDRIANLFSPSSSDGVSPFFDTVVNWLRRAPPERDGRGGDWVAHKCDLCADHADQACVTACPTGAAFRFDPIAALGEGVHLGLAAKERGDG
jgi:Fe-S-cluster-containing dehydrogenase component